VCTGFHTSKPASWRKTFIGRWPNVSRRFRLKQAAVTVEGGCIPVAVFLVFLSAALRRAVVQRFAKNRAAKSIPVGPGVSEVQMPSLIHRVRRRDWVTGAHGEINKSSVFLNHAVRM
jgi:hypothetical protein